MDLIESDNEIICNEMLHKLSKDISTIKRVIQKLKEKGLLIKTGTDKDVS